MPDQVMEDTVTMGEITARFESEWVLIDDPQTNNALEVLSGHVLFHSADRDAVYQEAINYQLKRSAILFTGEIPDDLTMIL